MSYCEKVALNPLCLYLVTETPRTKFLNPTKAYKKNKSDERDRVFNLWMVMREQETRVHVTMETSVMNETSEMGLGIAMQGCII